MLSLDNTELGQIETQSFLFFLFLSASALMVLTLCHVLLVIVGMGRGTVYMYLCVCFYLSECCPGLEMTCENSAQTLPLSNDVKE